MVERRLVLFSILLILPASSRAQVPAGPVMPIPTVTSSAQSDPRLALDVHGDLFIGWTNTEAVCCGRDVYAERIDVRGARRGAEFLVNTFTPYFQIAEGVAVQRDGGFVVTWNGPQPQSTGVRGVFAQRYDAAGARAGGEFMVSAPGADAFGGNVAAGPAGGFIVIWGVLDGLFESNSYARRYDADGAPRGAEFVLNSSPTAYRTGSAVGYDASGRFVVAWIADHDPTNGIGMSLFVRRYDAAGVAQGPELLVYESTHPNLYGPGLAVGRDGTFVVAWGDPWLEPKVVAGRRYTAGGSPLGADFLVDSTIDHIGDLSLAMDDAGRFVVAWESRSVTQYGIALRRFEADGTPRGAALRRRDDSISVIPLVVSDPVGNFTLAWTAFATGPHVFLQRYGGLRPEALDVDTAGNRVLEPGEAVDVRPAWRNVNGAVQTFSGGLSAITGPSGASYAITDGAGGYGTVPDGAAASCDDCYAVSVSAPGTRPARHWDASVAETLVPDAQGQRKAWALHVGESFSDVPRTSPFYRFIETLLHRGVTAGCRDGTTFCPLAPVSREEMAVFLLVAREGAASAPPACVPPNLYFDVPEASPFCPFIEELSRRGVVTGCGLGNYCPAGAVTREQMAQLVFRTLDPTFTPRGCTTPLFADVDPASSFCRWIEELARRGVTSGCGGGNFCPSAAVTREQMGVFLGATFGLTLYGQ